MTESNDNEDSMENHYVGFYLNRTMCDVLEDMRKLSGTRNYGGMDGLIEELQSMANRMEAGLQDQKDIQKLSEQQRKARKELKELVEAIGKLQKEKRKLIGKANANNKS